MGDHDVLTISQAAERLGVSSDTIKRRIKRGEYADAYRQKTPQGFRWMIPVVDLDLGDVAGDQATPQDAPGSTQTGDQGQQDPQVAHQLIETLQRELDIRNREIERLHIVVAQQSAAIERQAAVIAALPDQVPERDRAGDQQNRPGNVDDVVKSGPQHRAQAAPAGLWRRLWDTIRGQ